MLAEHEQGRVYIRNMSQAVVDYEVGNAEATALLVKYITDYIELLEQHISKENTMLFSMADKHRQRCRRNCSTGSNLEKK